MAAGGVVIFAEQRDGRGFHGNHSVEVLHTDAGGTAGF